MADDEYVPTLREYAEVIAWLDDERRLAGRTSAVGTAVVPDNLRLAYLDAIHREGLGRVARAMEAAADAEQDRCDECMDGLHQRCTDVEDGTCCCPPGDTREFVAADEDGVGDMMGSWSE